MRSDEGGHLGIGVELFRLFRSPTFCEQKASETTMDVVEGLSERVGGASGLT